MDFNYFLLTERFKQMQRYLQLVQAALSEEQKNFKSYLQKLDEEYPDYAIELKYDELVEVRDEFPRLTYSSFLVSWFALIEHELIQLCVMEDLQVSIRIRDQEQIGRGINRAYLFLKEGADFEIPQEKWQELTKIRKIRNVIVHQDGRIRTYPLEFVDGKGMIEVRVDEDLTVYVEADRNLYHYLEQHSMIDFQGALLYINPTFEYCNRLVEFGLKLFSLVYEALDLK